MSAPDIGDDGLYFEHYQGAWGRPRLAVVTGLPGSSEQAGTVHLFIHPNPEFDPAGMQPITRKYVAVWPKRPRPDDAGPITGDGHYGVFVPDGVPTAQRTNPQP